MKTGRQILILYAGRDRPPDLLAIAGSLEKQGATVILRELGGDYDAALEEISRSDTVVCWK